MPNHRRLNIEGGTRIAMRTGSGGGTSGLVYLLGDHLGSTALTADGASGARLGELRYKPWGELRYVWGVTMTGYRYTGQRMEGTGLYDYAGGTRWYDPMLGRWAQPDSIVPLASQGVQAWDRYAFVNNNMLRYNDPSGHWADDGCNSGGCNRTQKDKAESIYFEKRAYYENCRRGTGDCPSVKISDEHQSIGLRYDNSFWAIWGVDINIDLMYFAYSGEIGVYLSPGAQKGAGAGSGETMGVILGNNMPNRGSYAGATYIPAGGKTPLLDLGASLEIEQFVGSPNTDGSVPSDTYLGIGP